MVNLDLLLQKVIDLAASDLHLSVGVPPLVRVDGVLAALQNQPPLSKEDVEALVLGLLSGEQKALYNLNKEVDLSLAFGQKARFRANVFTEQGRPAAALRLIPWKVPTLE